MSGNTKEKIAVHNNAGKKTPAATAPMANAYANATVLGKIENLAATFRHRKCNETNENSQIGVAPVDRCPRQCGLYVATGSTTDRSLRSDQMKGLVGRYVATDLFAGRSRVGRGLVAGRSRVGCYVATD
ncbi:hypothetical protein F2Q69_00047909 [Brassica cretica]|uniref:Uncharacterized protein n=1 Tax=Brassica cretica TaxID=69181 RepID=A0A8S9PSS8_BRACR|nr:hypothetical protein F2Q69_00047909 [Brassica cretica]